MGIGGAGGGDFHGLALGRDFEIAEDEVAVRGEGEFVGSLKRRVWEGVEADAGQGA